VLKKHTFARRRGLAKPGAVVFSTQEEFARPAKPVDFVAGVAGFSPISWYSLLLPP